MTLSSTSGARRSGSSAAPVDSTAGRQWLLPIVSLLFILISAIFLYSRNLYEDEVNSFLLIPQSASAIWQLANHTDVHPPGMYLLSHLFYRLTGSERWLVVGPLGILFVGLMVFTASSVSHFKNSRPALILFLLLAWLHPQLLMWSNSARWYPYWTAAALVVLAITLQFREDLSPPPLSRGVAAGIGLLLGLMFYLSYLTIFFVAALGAAYLVRYPIRRAYLSPLLIALALFGLLASPQLLPLLRVHLANGGAQQSSLAVSFVRLCQGVFLSEAMLPWRPVGVLFIAFVIVPLIVLQFENIYSVATRYRAVLRSAYRPLWLSLLVFFTAMFALGCVLRIGSKPRSFLVLCPVFAFLAAHLLQQIGRKGVQYAMIGITGLWIAQGSIDLISKTGTAKGGINDHPEEVINLVQKKAHGTCAIIFTSEPALTYALNEAAQREPWTICSVSADYIHSRRQASAPTCQPQYAFVVESYVGALHAYKQELALALHTAEETIAVPEVANLSPDPDVRFKRIVPGFRTASADFPDFRFIVYHGRVKPKVDWEAVTSAFDFYQPPEWQGIAAWSRSTLHDKTP